MRSSISKKKLSASPRRIKETSSQNKSNRRKVALAIPTYNEAKNIENLIRQLEKAISSLKNWHIEIFIIDDNSPDGTALIIKSLQKIYTNIHVLSGEKKGLGAAYTRGFEHILKHFNPDYVIQMDADLQHNPKDISRLLAETKKGYEFIIGSRYVAGGDYPNWSFKRKLYSWGANVIARNIAGIKGIDDCTSGFRCISGRFLKSFNIKTLKANGYAFQMNLLHAACKKKIPITQIPILFPNRKKGKSKLQNKDIREFFINAFKLRFKRYKWKK